MRPNCDCPILGVQQGSAVAVSADGTTAISGGPGDGGDMVGDDLGAGGGSAQTFTITFSDKDGWQNLQVVDVLINGALDARHACYFAFVPSGANSGSFLLVLDDGNSAGPFAVTAPSGGSAENSQCEVRGTGSSVTAGENTLTLTVSITFGVSFGGNRLIYVSAQDAHGTSGWQPLGMWSKAPPAVTGVSPAHSAGASQTYAFTFTDEQGWQDIGLIDVLIHGALDGSNACYFAFMPVGGSGGSLYLVDDKGRCRGTVPGDAYNRTAYPGRIAMHRRFVVISGLPASGKSTLAHRLAPRLDLPVIDKDTILESLFESKGAGDRAWRRMLSRESDAIFQARALASPGAILVSFWHRPGMPADSGTPTGWLAALPQPLVHLHCVCPPGIAAQRFLRRERHHGHLDTERSYDEVLDSLRAIDRLPPVPIEPRIEVRTDREVRLEPILRALPPAGA